jgi:hypothetical protein
LPSRTSSRAIGSCHLMTARQARSLARYFETMVFKSLLGRWTTLFAQNISQLAGLGNCVQTTFVAEVSDGLPGLQAREYGLNQSPSLPLSQRGEGRCRNIEPTSSMLSTSFVRPTYWFAMTMRRLSRGREASYRRQTSNSGTSTASFFDFRGVPGHLHKAGSALSGCLMSEPQCRSLGPSDPEG